ncbi:hypothetical protein D3C73_1667970 [compost metagenome]
MSVPQTEDVKAKSKIRTRKSLIILLKIVGALSLAIVLFLGIVFVVNVISDKS